jgi:hypothetical protein
MVPSPHIKLARYPDSYNQPSTEKGKGREGIDVARIIM